MQRRTASCDIVQIYRSRTSLRDVIRRCAAIVQVHAVELAHIIVLDDSFVNHLVGAMFDRSLKASPLRHMDDTMLMKPHQVAMPQQSAEVS